MALRNEDVLPPGFRLHWYQLQSVLGDGGFGITYLGRDTNLNQSVAIKEYFPKNHVYRGRDHRMILADETEPAFVKWGMQRFLDEARLLARFRHPHIVRVLSVFETLDTAFMVMELERGSSLGDAVRSHALVTDEQVLSVAIPLLDGLQLVHEAGFIHRDIKPSNILLRPGLGPVLIDFGSARQPMPGSSSSLTAIVSRGYAPFEQYDAGNEQRQGPWSDIYGLAATLYHVITGNPAVDAVTRGMNLLNGDPDPLLPCQVCAGTGFSTQLLAAIDRGLAFKARDRPQTVAEWRALFPAYSGQHWVDPQVRTEALDRERHGIVVRERWRGTGGRGDSEPAPITKLGGPHSEASTIRNPGLPGAVLRERRVLVVDDDRSARTLTRRVLANLGATHIDEASSAREALARLEDAQAVSDVLLVELGMASVDGVQLIRKLGERRVRAALVLVADAPTRVLDAAEHLARGHGLVVLGSVTKPLSPAALSAILARLDRAPAERDTATVRDSSRAVPTVDSLRTGIAGGAVELVYLPVVGLKPRELLGAEALVRWNDGSDRKLDAATLVQHVEAAGLADAFTERVLHKALAQAGDWHAAGLPCGVSVNMFAASLARVDLPEYLVEVAQQEGVTLGDLTLEVNELRFQRQGQVPLEVLTRLRLRGAQVALDDFGTGSLGLDRLRHIPFTELKVDRGFVATAVADRTSRAILESAVSLARRLGIRATAEGVEDAATERLVTELGFDAAQGYGICTPLAGDELLDWSRDWTVGRSTVAPRPVSASA